MRGPTPACDWAPPTPSAIVTADGRPATAWQEKTFDPVDSDSDACLSCCQATGQCRVACGTQARPSARVPASRHAPTQADPNPNTESANTHNAHTHTQHTPYPPAKTRRARQTGISGHDEADGPMQSLMADAECLACVGPRSAFVGLFLRSRVRVKLPGSHCRLVKREGQDHRWQ